MTKGKSIVVLLFAVLWVGALQVLAQPAISPEMIEQFKRLTRAEQEALARDYGVDIDQLQKQQSVQSVEIGARPASPAEQLDAPGAPEEVVRTSAKAEFLVTDADLADDETEFAEPVSLPRFGAGLFDASVSTFAPTDNAPVPPGYLIGPGDSFNVYLYGKETGDHTLFVNREGMIIFPKIGPVQVAGMTYEEAKSSIKQRIESQFIGVSSIVSFGRMRAINLVITGEVSTPGMYSVSALTTVTQALFTVGGVSEIGSLRNIEVKRLGESVIVFDAYDLLLRGDIRNDIRLHNGDVVHVHTVGPQASITGAVNRPAIYEIKTGKTIGDLV
ncbi:uncharacterized protein METZ01_LOCUS277553, partial [marine metagenome]